MLTTRIGVRSLHFVVLVSLLTHTRAFSTSMKRFLVNSGSNTAAKVAKVEAAPTGASGSVAARPKPLLTPTILTSEDIAQAKTSVIDKWTSYGGIMYKLSGPRKDVTDMVAFDMDGTLITTKSGKTFAVNEHDWKLWDPSVKTVLQRLHAENKYLAIISNQSGVKEKKITKEALQSKVDSVIEALGVPMDFICAIEDDRFRKPRTGMWEFLCQARNATANAASAGVIASNETTAIATTASTATKVFDPNEVESNSSDDEYAQPRASVALATVATSSTTAITTSTSSTSSTSSSLPLCAPVMFASSLYVGDAAGRVKEGTRNKDFSDSDYKLALNLGIEVSSNPVVFLVALCLFRAQNESETEVVFFLFYQCIYLLTCIFIPFSIFSQFATPEKYFLGSTSRLHCQLPDPSADVTTPVRMIDVVSFTIWCLLFFFCMFVL